MLKGKKKNLTILLVAIVNVILTFIAMSGLDKMGPIKVFATEREKMASTQTLLIIPIIVLALAVFQIVFRLKTMDKHVTTGKLIEDGGFAFLTGTLISFNWLLVYICSQYTITKQINVDIPVAYIVMGLIGLVLVGIYSTFPINKFGSKLGLRTKETLADDEVWRLSNRFNGFTGFVSALIIVALAGYFIVNGFNFVYLLVGVIICAFLMFYIPRLYAKMVSRKKAERIIE